MPVIIDGTLGVNAAAITTTNWNPTNLTIPGNSTIGDASSDTLTVNATPTFTNGVSLVSQSGASAAYPGLSLKAFTASQSAHPVIQTYRAGGTEASPTASSGTLLRQIAYGHNGTSFIEGAQIFAYQESAWSVGSTPAGMQFFTNDGTTGSAARVTISSAGKVGVGTASPSLKLHVYDGASSNTLPANNQAVFEYSANGGIAISVPSANAGGVYFPRGTDAYYSGIERSATALNIRNNNATQVTVGTDGVVSLLNGNVYFGYGSTGGATYIRDNAYLRFGSLNSTGGAYIGYAVRAKTTSESAGTNELVSTTSSGLGRAAIMIGSASGGTAGLITMHTGPGESGIADGGTLANFKERLRIDDSGNVNIGYPGTNAWSKFMVSMNNGSGVNNTPNAATRISDFQGAAIIVHNQDGVGTGSKAGLFFATAGAPGVAAGIAGYKNSGTWGTGLQFYTNNITGGSYTDVIQEKMRLNQDGNLGIATTSPEFKLDIAESTVPLRRITTNPGGHAINSGYLETRNVGISLSALATEWITKTSVPSGNWIVKLTGVWENNMEGGGLVPPPAETYIHPNYPYIYVGSVQVQVLRDSGSGRLYLRNNDSAYAAHFTGEISITSVPQGYVPGYSANHFSMNLTGNSTHVNQGMSGGLILSTPCYSEYQFRWSGMASHTTTLTCGSYQMSEIIYTAHQSNSAADNNEYVRGKWSNNHDSHIWTEFEHSGNITAMETSFTVSADTVYNSGKLIIQETYPSYGPSYSFSNLIVRCYYGGFSISHT